MPKKFVLIFDEVILKQLKKAGKNVEVRQALSRMFDKLELLGPAMSDLVDSQLHLYEIKQKRTQSESTSVTSKMSFMSSSMR